MSRAEVPKLGFPVIVEDGCLLPMPRVEDTLVVSSSGKPTEGGM